MASSTVAIIIIVITIAFFIWGKFPMSVVSMAGAVAMAILVPEVELSAVYEGFSSSGWIMVVGMCVVSAALFETGVAERIGKIIGNSWWGKSERRFVVAAATCCTIMSAFMSNNGTVAIWMPLIAIVAAGSAGKIHSKMVIFAAGTGAIIGGGSTLIGSTSQLAANSVLQGYKGYEAGLGVFDMTKIMLPVCIVQIIFWGTLGYWLLKKVLKPGSPHFNDGNIYAEELFKDTGVDKYADVPKWKGNVALGTMILCIFLFIIQGFEPFSNYLNIGLIGMIGAVIVIATGCIGAKQAYADLPWDVFIVIGTVSTLGTGLDVTGGVEMIANFVLNFFGGENASVPVLTVVIAVLCSILTNFMQNNATAAMLCPICIPMAIALGISPVPWVILIAATSNFAIATSYGTAVNIQILPAGYKFMDYVKIGGPLLIISIIVVSIAANVVLF